MGKYNLSYVKSSFNIDGETVFGYGLLIDMGYQQVRLKCKPEVIAELFELPISRVKSITPDQPAVVGFASFVNSVPSTYKEPK